MAGERAGAIPAEDFAQIVDDMAAAMRPLHPAANRNLAAQGLRALLDAGYVPLRAAHSETGSEEGEPAGIERELLRTIDQQTRRISEQEDRIGNLLGALRAAHPEADRAPEDEDTGNYDESGGDPF